MPSQTARELVDALVTEQLVTIYVGDRPEGCSIQRTLLTNASPWFAKALDERFAEGQSLTLRFPDTDPQVVEYFVYYLFHGRAPFQDYAIDVSNREEAQLLQLLSLRLWVFADEHLLPALQNQAIRSLHYLTFDLCSPRPSTMLEALESSSPGSALRRFMMAELILELRRRHSLDKKKRSVSSESVGFTPADIDAFPNIPGFTKELTEGFLEVLSGASLHGDDASVEPYLVPETVTD
ncbi:hypothetical protein LTR37_015747 [Vermiconidia calcicola]|uniref:Uncharacterized protein n=1 Tax=Vermiconidia calcicola TaxID=1690605 RepID=A0ACC3MPQ2_9PEZI|nr:hypothetical protein LTR37_015747 [Vermiconidia calcicola]